MSPILIRYAGGSAYLSAAASILGLVFIGLFILSSPLTAAGGLLAGVAYPIWAIWLGRVLLSGRWAAD